MLQIFSLGFGDDSKKNYKVCSANCNLVLICSQFMSKLCIRNSSHVDLSGSVATNDYKFLHFVINVSLPFLFKSCLFFMIIDVLHFFTSYSISLSNPALCFLQTKWCPAPGCEYAVTFDAGSGNYDVSCLCSYGFCWNVSCLESALDFYGITLQNFHIPLIGVLDLQCTEEAHRPVDCGTVSKWILKNSAESENMNWYIIYFDICRCQFLAVLY